MKSLYFGDCLDVLKQLSSEYPKGFIDLIYIDPPFNSKRNYNILFEDINMKDTKAQREAFADTWSNVSYKDTLYELETENLYLYDFLDNLEKIGMSQSIIAYLTTMAIRILYMHKTLKDTGSFYLHCDPTMSHYLKAICDQIFLNGKMNARFINEITWKRSIAHSDAKRKFADVNDIILFYSKSDDYTFNPIFIPHDENSEYVKKFYRHNDNDGRGLYQLTDISSPNPRPNMMYNWKGFPYPEKGWRYEKSTMEKLDNEKRIYYPKTESGDFDFNRRPRLKRYLKEQKGTIVSNNWTDIAPISAHAKERLGYPTQKPEALLERIIKASSNQGDVVADFFCGCGTTIATANKLNRQWIGVDISHLAIKLILKRLTDPLNNNAKHNFLKEIEVHGFPKDIASAKALAEKDAKGRFEFQSWVVEFLLGGILNPRKTADGGWDGYLTFKKNNNEKGRVLIEVKSGSVSVKNVREFINVLDTSEADIGIFVCFEESITNSMITAAKNAGKYKPYKFDRIQLLTIEDILLNDKGIILPGGVQASVFKNSVTDSRPMNQDPELF